MTPNNQPPMKPQLGCLHFWSAPAADGMVECAWCRLRVPAALRYDTSNTLDPTPERAP